MEPELESLSVAVGGLARASTQVQRQSMLEKVHDLLQQANDEVGDKSRLLEQKEALISQYRRERDMARRKVEELQARMSEQLGLTAPSQTPPLATKEREAYETKIEQLNGEVDFFKEELERTQKHLQELLDRPSSAQSRPAAAAAQAAQAAHRVVSGGLEAGFAVGKSLAGRIGGSGAERDPRGNIYTDQAEDTTSIYSQGLRQPPPPPLPPEVARGQRLELQEETGYRSIYNEQRGSGLVAGGGAVPVPPRAREQGVESKIWVMRHAEKLDDVDDAWAASAPRPYDAPITPTGVEQARAVGAELAASGARIDVVACSPFLRCLQTAEHVLEAYQAGRPEPRVQVAVDLGLSEVMTKRNVPVAPTMLSEQEALSLAPGLKGRLMPAPDGGYAISQAPSWPETMTAAMARYTETLLRLPQRFPQRNILVVAHGDTVAQFVSMTEKVRWGAGAHALNRKP